MFDWNDLRFVLAIARSGSTLGASRLLRVSQATVSRRITVLEEALGFQLFVRRPSGYSLTARGELLLPHAASVEEAVDRFAHVAEAESRRLSGRVRITTVESAANAWIIPAVAALHATHPDVEVEVITTDTNLDLVQGEADIAIRFGPRPEQESLIVRPLTELEECFYASRDLATRIGRPADYAGLSAYPLVSDTVDRSGRFARWIEENVPAGRIAHRVNSMSGIVASVRAGIGAAALPCIMGDDLRGLVRLMPPIPELSTACWLVTTDTARRQPHIRAVIDHVVSNVLRVTQRAEVLAAQAG
jgi:DNA-binding transcriptional LysR family regulator